MEANIIIMELVCTTLTFLSFTSTDKSNLGLFCALEAVKFVATQQKCKPSYALVNNGTNQNKHTIFEIRGPYGYSYIKLNIH